MSDLDAISWNLFHGRDAPPNEGLFTLRSRLLGMTESDATHVQVNRQLLDEFTRVLGGLDWDVALLQEAPPRWLRPLCSRLGVHGASALTARNFGAVGRALIAAVNPDLIASGEGGSNQLLVRPPWRIVEVRRLTLTRRPERRRMLWARLEGPPGAVCVANLHATAHDEAAAARDVELAAAAATEWSGAQPLLFGGDLNLRPRSAPAPFKRLEEAYGLVAPSAADAVDHLLAHGLTVPAAPTRLPASARDLRVPEGKLIRLSDHAPLVARFGLAAAR